MSKNQQILFVSLGLIGLGLYFFYKQRKQNAELAEDIKNQNGVVSIADYNKVLKKGSKGIEVRILQKALKGLVVDGDFGAKTEARLKSVVGVTEVSLNKYNELLKNKK